MNSGLLAATAILAGVLLGLGPGAVPQARAAIWQVPVSVRNGTAVGDTIAFGVHPEATPGIDPTLGEVGLPPWPPSSLFEVRWIVTGSEGAKLDLRDTTHVERTHEIQWQPGAGGYPIVVRWNRAALPYATLHIQDGYGGVFIPPRNMFEVDSLVIPATWSFIRRLQIKVIPGVSPGAAPLFPAPPEGRIFSGQRFPDYRLDDFVTDPDTPDSLLVWTVSDVEALTCVIEDRILHVTVPESWTGTEVITLTVRDPEWHFAHQEMTLRVLPGGLPTWSIPLSIHNAGSEARRVEIGIHPQASDGIDAALGEVALPPWPPSSAFEARLVLPDTFTESVRDVRCSAPDTILFHLRWQPGTPGYPVTVDWSPDLPLGEFRIEDDMGGAFIPPVDMSTSTQVVVPPEQSFLTGLHILTCSTVDTLPPAGPTWLLSTNVVYGDSISLLWDECSDDHFAYYEVVYDSSSRQQPLVWDWSEDPGLGDIHHTSTTIPIPGAELVYRFRVRAWDTFGNVGPFSSLLPVGTGVPDDVASTRSPAIRLTADPNPFGRALWLRWALPPGTSGVLRSFDVAGRLLLRREVMPDPRTGRGETDLGEDAASWPSGIYFIRLSAGEGEATRRVIKIR